LIEDKDGEEIKSGKGLKQLMDNNRQENETGQNKEEKDKEVSWMEGLTDRSGN
jgi:hypothetical protein